MTVDTKSLSEMAVDEVLLALGEVGNIADLDLLEEAERGGKGRVSVLNGIEARRNELADEVVEADPLPEEVSFSTGPVPEVMPIIRVGDWARISGNASKVPAHARGRDVMVLRAPIRIAGNDVIHSSGNYEYQLVDDVFEVQLRDTREQFSCTRAAFAAFGPDRGGLDGLLV